MAAMSYRRTLVQGKSLGALTRWGGCPKVLDSVGRSAEEPPVLGQKQEASKGAL